jgi:hypothetical protein
MDRITRSLALILILTMTIPSLIMVKPANAQSIPKPAVPEFNLAYVDNSYEVPSTTTIDPYTGKTGIIQGYHVSNQSVVLSIKNQPFTSVKLDNGNYTHLYYTISYKGHYAINWSSYNHDLETDWFLMQSEDSEYTIVNFQQLPTEGEVDYSVQAQIGYYIQYFTPFRIHEFTGQTSDWSNVQTISIPDGEVSTTISPSPSPTVPEFSTLTCLLLVMISVSYILLTKKHPLKNCMH